MKKLLFISFLWAVACSRSPENVNDVPVLVREPLEIRYTGREMNPSARLRKLSMHLRGITPSEADYQALAEAVAQKTVNSFFTAKTKEYMAGPGYVGKMIDRLDELFRMKLASGLPETRLYGKEPVAKLVEIAGGETFNSMDLLFERLVRENLSWDQILVSKDYAVQAPAPTGLSRPSDLGFFNIIAPHLPPAGDGAIKTPVPPPTKSETVMIPLKFEEQDPRIAGALTTSRFVSRYSTTNLNKNRGRAAAVFRIFLCDDMKAVVEPKAGEEDELLNNAFPKPDTKDEASVENFWHATDADEQKHGSSPACMACHYKLDPMGRAFVGIGSVLPTEAAPSALVYKRADGSLVEAGAKGIGEIARLLVKQPEYVSCQVSRFWQWFIRADEPPTAERLKELVKAFESTGRRTNDFVAYLVNQPEFYQDPGVFSSEVTLLHVTPILKQCDSCHQGLREPPPSLLKFPIGGDEKSHKEWLTDIAAALDLPGDGAAKTMPPKKSEWKPTKDDIALIKEWVGAGAKSEDGKPSLDLDYAKKLVKLRQP